HQLPRHGDPRGLRTAGARTGLRGVRDRGGYRPCPHPDRLVAGTTLTFPFHLKIDTDRVGHDGNVKVAMSFPEADDTNDTTALDAEVTASGLPITGTSPAPLAGGGLGLLLLGALLLVAARRAAPP